MFDTETLSFESEDELRKPVPAGTEALVQVRPDKDGVLGNFKSGTSDYGNWMLVPFEVIEGEHRGEWASMILNIKTNDRKFRAVFEAITGVDISAGGNVSFADFKTALCEYVFKVELGPEKRKGVETGYTTVVRVIERVRPRGGAASAPASAVEAPQSVEVNAGTGGEEEDDIPF